MNDVLQLRNVLVVDDTKANIHILVHTLRDEYKLGVAINGAKALAYVEEHHPDLVLLDIMMPEMDGYEVCAQLKANPNTRDIPVIFITAMTEIEDKIRGFELGAVDYITKPFEVVEVKARVKTHLLIEQYRRDLEARNQDLQKAQGQLQRQVRELEGRDRLVRAQMSVSSLGDAGDEILAVFEQVLGVEQAAIYCPDRDNESLELLAGRGVTYVKGAIGLDDDTSPIVQAFKRSQCQGLSEGEVVLPLLRGNEVLGVLWAQGVPVDSEREEGAKTLESLVCEAVLVLNAARMAEELENGELGVEALLNMDE